MFGRNGMCLCRPNNVLVRLHGGAVAGVCRLTRRKLHAVTVLKILQKNNRRESFIEVVQLSRTELGRIFPLSWQVHCTYISRQAARIRQGIQDRSVTSSSGKPLGLCSSAAIRQQRDAALPVAAGRSGSRQRRSSAGPQVACVAGRGPALGARGGRLKKALVIFSHETP